MWARFKRWLAGGYDCRLQGVIEYLQNQGFTAAAQELQHLQTEIESFRRGRR